jgi:magnesium transporter
VIVDCAVYEQGRRQDVALDLAQAGRAARDGAFAWIGLAHPTHEEFDAIRREFELHELAVEAVEEEVFSDERTNPAERIYGLKRRAVELHRAIGPLVGPLDDLARGAVGGLPAELRTYLRDVHDHALRAAERVDALRDLLTGVLEANLAQVGVRQNEDMRRISAWVAIIAVPTMIAGIYGMNFEHMPELGWRFGYPLAVAVMAAACATLYRAFKRAGWL